MTAMNYSKNFNKLITFKGEILWQNVQNVMAQAENPAEFAGAVNGKFSAWGAADVATLNTKTGRKKPVSVAMEQKFIFP